MKLPAFGERCRIRRLSSTSALGGAASSSDAACRSFSVANRSIRAEVAVPAADRRRPAAAPGSRGTCGTACDFA